MIGVPGREQRLERALRIIRAVLKVYEKAVREIIVEIDNALDRQD